jgi:hypothetical protein
MTGTTSGTARAWSRGLVRRKRKANSWPDEQEARMRQMSLDEQAKNCKVRRSFGRRICIRDGCMGGKSVRNTRGDLPSRSKEPGSPEGESRRRQKSAEGIVAHEP